jgi:hypothetical protein
VNDPTCKTATFNEWHRVLCDVARESGGSASTPAPWMRRLYDRQYTPRDAWDAFNNDEV